MAESLGLRINFPAGASVVAERVNGSMAFTVVDAQSPPSWSMRVQPLTSTLARPSPPAQVDELLNELTQRNEPFTLISNVQLNVSGRVAQLCYVRRQGIEDQPYVAGWLVVPTGPRTFLVLSVQMLPDRLAALRPVLEACFASMQVRDVAEVDSDRKKHLEAGRAFLQSLTPEQLKSLVGHTQWYRIFGQGTDGKEVSEKGYALLEVLEAKKGALNPSRQEQTYDADARKTGMLVRIQHRIAVNPERGVYYDSIGLYWMAWDQSEEAWSLLATHRQGEAEQTEAETGVRTARSESAGSAHLTVIKADRTTNSREPYEWDLPEVYLSQPLHWLLGKLLPADSTADQEYAFYCYNFTVAPPKLSQRLDVWGPAPERRGAFQLTTRMSPEAAPSTATYAADGSLIRRVHSAAGGFTITEPSTPDEIRRLWKSKGLQFGKASR